MLYAAELQFERVKHTKPLHRPSDPGELRSRDLHPVWVTFRQAELRGLGRVTDVLASETLVFYAKAVTSDDEVT